MRRTNAMLRYTDCCKEYKNGNITIKYDEDAISDARKDAILTISEILSQIDCVFIGDSFCLSNYEIGHLIYNLYSGYAYIFPWRFLDTLLEGKTIRLYASVPDADTLRYIEEGEQ